MDNYSLFRDIAHHRSFSRGSRLNGVSQSAASQHVRELERQLSVQLVDRSTRPLLLTEAGKLYLEYCRDVLRRRGEFDADLSQLQKQASGIVRLAAIYSVGLSEMSRVEAEFRERYPEGRLEVSYLRPEKIFEAVHEDQADLGLVSYAESTRDIISLPWLEEEMVVAVSPGHRLAAYYKTDTVELQGEPFIGFDEDLPIRANVDRYLRDRGVSVDVVLHFDNLEMIKETVAHNVGISILPERAMREDLRQNRLVAIRLNPADLFRPVRIIHRRRKLLGEAAAGLLKLLQEGGSEAHAEQTVVASEVSD
jgi:LysR family transcriptional regulator, transcriptional activator of the cysJI operon